MVNIYYGFSTSIWPIIKWFAKSASFEHAYSGKETRSWQFEGVSPDKMNFFSF